MSNVCRTKTGSTTLAPFSILFHPFAKSSQVCVEANRSFSNCLRAFRLASRAFFLSRCSRSFCSTGVVGIIFPWRFKFVGFDVPDGGFGVAVGVDKLTDGSTVSEDLDALEPDEVC